MAFPDLPSVPLPILFFAGFLLVLTLVGAFALRLAGFEDDSEFYEEIGPDGKVRVAFQFPPHENREDRRRRWARALRRRFWPGLAPGPDCPELNAKADKIAEALIRAILASSTSSKPSTCQTASQLPPLDPICAPEYEIFVPPAPEEPPPAEVSPQEAGKLRKKIFGVVMNAGPPKTLQPITEERHASVDVEAAEDLECGERKVILGRASMPGHLHSAWQLFSRSGQKDDSRAWAELDAEPVMTVGNVKASRAVLWAALRHLEHLETSQLHPQPSSQLRSNRSI